MHIDFYEIMKLFSKNGNSKLLAEGNFGVELESQRVKSTGDLALTPHPSVFGDKAENPHITTDFSESQIEMVTPSFKSVKEVYASLQEIYDKVKSGIGDELLWPLSMPPRLPNEEAIPIAKFSDTEEGREKELYRKGLALRYSKKMQMISGIHYNFSFSEEMIDYLYEQLGDGKDRTVFVNDMYFALIRNFLRYRWLLIYLFGASPFCDPSYYSVIYKELKVIQECCPECCYTIEDLIKRPTSLRVSRFGYSNISQGMHNIYFNSLEEYIWKLKKMMTTASSKYLELGLYQDEMQVQLNGNVLQKESEFYSPIRPKQNVRKGEQPLDALIERGVEYLEVRILDINPFERLGISLGQMNFLQVFMLYCLFEQSSNITQDEFKKININHHVVALFGREEDLLIHDYNRGVSPLKSMGEKVFEKLRFIAELMDKGTAENKYQQSVGNEYQKLFDQSLLPSEKIYQEMEKNNESYLEFGIRQAVNNSQNSIGGIKYDNKRLRRT